MTNKKLVRRRARLGYLACAICKSDLPAEEFRQIKRVFAGKVKLYRNSYCRPCLAEYTATLHRSNMRADPIYRERHRKRLRDYRHRTLGRELRKAREERSKLAREAILRLDERGWSNSRIARTIGSARESITLWRAGKGRPTEAHIWRLRGAGS